MRLHCFRCGKAVSTEVPDGTLVRGAIECPECTEANSMAEVTRIRAVAASLISRREIELEKLLHKVVQAASKLIDKMSETVMPPWMHADEEFGLRMVELIETLGKADTHFLEGRSLLHRAVGYFRKKENKP